MEVISRWHHLVDNFNTSTLDFYAAVEEAVKARDLPDAKAERVEFKEGTVVSAKREYLRIQRDKVAFDICAAPFGNGFFFSWWLVRPGPAHPWLLLMALLAATALWLLLLGNALTRMAQESVFGGGGDAGALFVVLFLGFPALVAFLGWNVREGNLGDEDVVMATPLIGWLYERVFNPQTYYRHDTALMFQDSVARAVGEVLNGLLQEQGLRALSPEELKPTIRDLSR